MRMKLLRSAALILPLVLLHQTAARAAAWTVDKDHSRVGFSVTHLGINTVHGRFTKYTAEVAADETTGKIAAVSAKVSVASVDTGVSDRDAHLRAADLFNAAQYPEMTFESTRINWNGNRFTGVGNLTIKDKTRPVSFRGSLSGVKTVTTDGKTFRQAGYRVVATVKRKAFGLVFGTFSEGLSMVGEEVSIALDIEIQREIPAN